MTLRRAPSKLTELSIYCSDPAILKYVNPIGSCAHLCSLAKVRACPYLDREFPNGIAARLKTVIESEAGSGAMKSAEVEAIMYIEMLEAISDDDFTDATSSLMLAVAKHSGSA